MVTVADGGGSQFSGGHNYHSYFTNGTEPLSNEDWVLHWTSHSFAGYTYNDGRADALHKVQQGINVRLPADEDECLGSDQESHQQHRGPAERRPGHHLRRLAG